MTQASVSKALPNAARGGYRLIYNDTPSDYTRKAEARRKVTDLTFSLGFIVGRESKLTDVLWGGPAYAAGLTVGTQIVAVNNISYDSDRLKDIIKGARATNEAIELFVKNGERYSTVHLDYRDGLRYPHLQRIPEVPARLDQVYEPKN